MGIDLKREHKKKKHSGDDWHGISGKSGKSASSKDYSSSSKDNRHSFSSLDWWEKPGCFCVKWEDDGWQNNYWQDDDWQNDDWQDDNWQVGSRIGDVQER